MRAAGTYTDCVGIAFAGLQRVWFHVPCGRVVKSVHNAWSPEETRHPTGRKAAAYLSRRPEQRSYLPPNSSEPSARNATVAQWAAEYHDLMRAYFFKRLNDWSEAEDLTQDLMVRAIRSATVVEVANPKAFLFDVADKVLKDRLRRKYTRKAYMDAVRPMAQTRTEEITPEMQLASKQALAGALKALDVLDARVKDAFLMHRVQGLTHSEIARRCGISVSSVEKYIIKCLAVMAAHIAEERK